MQSMKRKEQRLGMVQEDMHLRVYVLEGEPAGWAHEVSLACLAVELGQN
jgi:hypothetical protein